MAFPPVRYDIDISRRACLDSFRYFAGLVAVVALTHCRDAGPDVTPATVVIPPVVSATLVSGTSISLTAVVSNAGGGVLTGQLVEWLSADPNIAAVSSAGVVTAIHTGEAQITATIGAVRSLPITLTVTPGAATRLAIRTQPTGAASGVPLATQPIVDIQDAAGNRVTSATATVTASLATGGGSVTCATATAVGGFAAFTGLSISGPVGDKTLAFSATGLAPVTSSGFVLGPGAPTKLALRVQPSGAASGAPLLTQPVVEIRDDAGNLTTAALTTVTATIGLEAAR